MQRAITDTIEVAANWSAIPSLYAAIALAVRQVHPQLHFGAHWSHVYPEGACQYMTVRLPPMDVQTALPLHAELWRVAQELTLVSGFINLAAFDAAGIPDRCVANPRHSGAIAVVCALRSGRQQPLGAHADL